MPSVLRYTHITDCNRSGVSHFCSRLREEYLELFEKVGSLKTLVRSEEEHSQAGTDGMKACAWVQRSYAWGDSHAQ